MRVDLVETEGYGRNAVVEVDGRRLTVRDALSTAEQPALPGPVRAARFEAVMVDPLASRREFGDNSDGIKALEHRWGWRYLGHGEVSSLDPIRVDFGVLILELAGQLDAEHEIGDFVTIAIDRISLQGGDR
jgi:hypothetical protein